MTDGAFRDLNHNGILDPYEDPSAPLETRVEDLLSRMTVTEKAGLMFHAMAAVDPGMTAALGKPTDFIVEKQINSLNAFGGQSPRQIAEWHNELQSAAESTRLGIPVTLSTDPRHAFTNNPATAFNTGGFSTWPEMTGLAATRDVELVREFANIARQEYLAVGFRMSLNPMADLATEPRWARVNGTFGEDVTTVSTMTAAYVSGFQGASLGPESVACMVKHFPGGGPQKDGEDPHFPYGREQIYPAGMFEHHLQPFEAAFEVGVAQVMPYYGMPCGTKYEEAGFAFNREIITGLLRNHYGFDGVVCADWGVLSDSEIFGKVLPARSWGVEHLSVAERAKKAIDAGIDQFGGESIPEVIIELVESGAVPESRIDASARRILRDKFRLGLFENPYVDVDAAEQIVGQQTFRRAGETAQRRSITVLENRDVLPIPTGTPVWFDGVDSEAGNDQFTVANSLDSASIAVIRVPAPFDNRDEYPLENFFHQGSLAFASEEIARITAIAEEKPTILAVDLDRPAILTELASIAKGLIGLFGASDDALIDILAGAVLPEGTLPFELPSSMKAVRDQAPDAPHDSIDPLYLIGHGLT